jgi:hypothetical protein
MRRLCTAAAAATAVIGMTLAGTAHGAGKPGSHGHHKIHHGKLTVITALTEQIPPPVVPAELVATASQAALLVDDYDTEFSAAWYDDTSNQVVIAASSSRGRQLAASTFANSRDVRVVDADLSHRALMDRVRRIAAFDPALREKARTLGVNAHGDGVYVEVYDPLTADEVSTLASAVRVRDVQLEVRLVTEPVSNRRDEDRRHDDSPYAGGMGYGIGSSRINKLCSAAYGYNRDGDDNILTAGHCFPKGTSEDHMFEIAGSWSAPSIGGLAGIWNGASTWGSDGTVVSPDGQRHGDLALVNVAAVGNSSTSRLWVGGPATGYREVVATRSAPYAGLFICAGGATSGDTCGNFRVTTDGTNIDHEYADGSWLRNGDRARNWDTSQGCAEGGDSGGAVYDQYSSSSDEAVGVISGHVTFNDGTCLLFFTGIEEAVQLWGGGPKMN